MPPAHARIFELLLCEECASKANVHDIVNNRRWAAICKPFEDANLPLPDRNSLKLIFKRTHNPNRDFAQ